VEPIAKRRPPVNNDIAKEMRIKIPTRSKSTNPNIVPIGDRPVHVKDLG